MRIMAGDLVPGADARPTDQPQGTDLVPTVDVWCITLDCEPPLIARARALLSADERARADAFHFQRLHDDFVAARATLRVLLSRTVGAAAGELRFAYGPQGKPALAGTAAASVQFNASHSGGLFACALASDRAIGVDVEQHRALPDLEPIARRFFSPAECRDLLAVPESTRTAAFYDCWSRKESFIKALGGGLSIALDSFRVSLSPERAALLEVRNDADEARAWTIRSFLPAAGFSGALAIRAPTARVQVRHASARGILAVLTGRCGARRRE